MSLSLYGISQQNGRWRIYFVAEPVLISLFAQQFEAPKLASHSQDEDVLLLNRLTVLFCKILDLLLFFLRTRGSGFLLHFAHSPSSSTTDRMRSTLRDLFHAHTGQAVCRPESTRS